MDTELTNKEVIEQAIREGREIIRDNWIEAHSFIPASIRGNFVYGKDNGADNCWSIDNTKNRKWKWHFADEPKESPKVAETSSPFNNGDKMKASQTNKEVVEQAIREKRPIRWVHNDKPYFTWKDDEKFYPNELKGDQIFGMRAHSLRTYSLGDGSGGIWVFADIPKEAPKVAQPSPETIRLLEMAIMHGQAVRCAQWTDGSIFYPKKFKGDRIVGTLYQGLSKTEDANDLVNSDWELYIPTGHSLTAKETMDVIDNLSKQWEEKPKYTDGIIEHKLDLSLKNALVKAPQKLYEVEIMPNSSLSGTLNVRQFIYVLTDTYLSALQKCEKFIPEKAIVTVSEVEHFILEAK